MQVRKSKAKDILVVKELRKEVHCSMQIIVQKTDRQEPLVLPSECSEKTMKIM